MISPAPSRPNSINRAAAIPARAAGAQGGDGDNLAALAALDARITALVARASSPEDDELARQKNALDLVARVQAEAERETNVLRDLAIEQMKHDDELLKKWIALI